MKNRIRELRKSKNISMKELGRIIGSAESTISHYETGRRQPDNDTLLKLSNYFGVTVGYLLGVEEKEAPPAIDQDDQQGQMNKNRIRELRKQKGITMKQLGLLFGFGEATISQYETGKRQPNYDTLQKLSEYFGVTVGYLIGAEEKEILPAISEDGQQDIVKRNIIRIAGRDGSIQERYLSDEQLSAVKSILDQLPDASDDL